jgi:hypothetical protein
MKIVLSLFHPIEPESGWMICQPVQTIHPRSLLGQGYFAETY